MFINTTNISRKKALLELKKQKSKEEKLNMKLDIDFKTIWPKLNNDTISKVINDSTLNITVATLSLYRYNLLIRSLEYNPNMTSIPLNICLRVQAAEEMSVEHKKKVIDLLEKNYKAYDLQFTYRNHGSGVPRHDVVHRALNHFGSKFVMTLDDDILMPKYGIEILASILLDNPNFGAVGLGYEPAPIVWKEKGNRLRPSTPDKGLHEVDAIGSGTTITRREVFEKCDLDINYYIGWGDMDFCKQMKVAGWKIAMLYLPNLKASNAKNKMSTDMKYYNIRYNAKHTKNSWNRYLQKWGIKIG